MHGKEKNARSVAEHCAPCLMSGVEAAEAGEAPCQRPPLLFRVVTATGVLSVPVEFPYVAYECQVLYMQSVLDALFKCENALLESPTGTGKTLCLLCASLAWRLHCFGSRARGPPIIYSSRTHGQLAQVVHELAATSYRPRMSVLGSRQQMCVHKDVSLLTGVSQNAACRVAVASRSCAHHRAVEPFLRSEPSFGAEPLDIEELVTIGRTSGKSGCGPCPYFLSRELAKDAEILFVPYNYLVDPALRQSLGVHNWSSAVILFDEAHNLESVCAEAASFDLPASHIAACIQEANECWESAVRQQESEAGEKASAAGLRSAVTPSSTDHASSAEDFLQLKTILRLLGEQIAAETPKSGPGQTRDSAHLIRMLASLNITTDTLELLSGVVDAAVERLASDAAVAGRRTGARTSHHRLHGFAQALKIVFRSLADGTASSYRVHFHEDASKKQGPCLSYWCMVPGASMQQLQELGVGSILLTSGTLAPMASFAHEFNLPFPVQLENKHVITPSQVWISVMAKGPSNVALNSGFRNRDSPAYKSELGQAIVNFASSVPDGMLVFFASYATLDSCIEHWKADTVWSRLSRIKHLVVEPRDSSKFSATRQEFESKLDDTSLHGVIFFAVCRGKVSEGLNFSDCAGRAVVITGIPYGMRNDPKLLLKRAFLDDQSRKSQSVGLTGDQWYTQSAMRAVNQAIGRVIRHKDDYGAVLLADERFSSDSMRSQLSLWLRPLVESHGSFGRSMQSLTQFFKRSSDSATVPPRLRPPPVVRQEPSGAAQAASGGMPLGGLEGILGVSGLLHVTVHSREQANVAAQKPQAGLSSLARLRSIPRPVPPVPPLAAATEPAVRSEPLANAPPEASESGAKGFLQRMKAVLDKPKFLQFQELFKSFKAGSIGVEALLQDVAALLGASSEPTLFGSFGAFLPPENQASFSAHLLAFNRARQSNPPTRELAGLKRTLADVDGGPLRFSRGAFELHRDSVDRRLKSNPGGS